MTETNAFPILLQPDYFDQGLSKREFFAAMALQGLLAFPEEEGSFKGVGAIAVTAVSYADALLIALAQVKEKRPVE